MKTPKTLAIFLSIYFCATVPPAAWAANGGHEVGNGGSGVICTSNPRTLTLLDLVDAEYLFGLKLPKLDPAAEKTDLALAKEVLLKLEPVDLGYYALAASRLDLIASQVHFIPKGSELQDLHDDFTPVLPVACRAVQLANYSDDWGLLVNPELWDSLDHTNRAALYVHEAIYSVERDLHAAKDSFYARRWVAYLFSDQPMTPELYKRLAVSTAGH